eukprot:scaffold55906_cov65-Phaeocystis_antarctica.AAC.1
MTWVAIIMGMVGRAPCRGGPRALRTTSTNLVVTLSKWVAAGCKEARRTTPSCRGLRSTCRLGPY